MDIGVKAGLEGLGDVGHGRDKFGGIAAHDLDGKAAGVLNEGLLWRDVVRTGHEAIIGWVLDF
jgi:hypothetical protein